MSERHCEGALATTSEIPRSITVAGLAASLSNSSYYQGVKSGVV